MIQKKRYDRTIHYRYQYTPWVEKIGIILPTSSRKGRLDDEQTQWSDVCDFIETEKQMHDVRSYKGDDDCKACTTVSEEK